MTKKHGEGRENQSNMDEFCEQNSRWLVVTPELVPNMNVQRMIYYQEPQYMRLVYLYSYGTERRLFEHRSC